MVTSPLTDKPRGGSLVVVSSVQLLQIEPTSSLPPVQHRSGFVDGSLALSYQTTLDSVSRTYRLTLDIKVCLISVKPEALLWYGNKWYPCQTVLSEFFLKRSA